MPVLWPVIDQVGRVVRMDFLDDLRQDLSAFYAQCPLGYIAMDNSGRIKQCNPAAQDLVGGKKGLLDTFFFDHIHQRDHHRVHMGPCHTTDSLATPVDIRLKSENGYRWVSVHMRYHQSTLFPERSTEILIEDIHDFKTLEHENLKLKYILKKIHRIQDFGQYSNGIVHDFNNILHPIILHLELLIQETEENQPLQSSLKDILNGATRAGNIVQQLTDFDYCNDSNLLSIEMQSIVREAIKLYQPSLPASIQIIQTIDDHCGSIRANPDHMFQVILNLITNAVHAMGKNGGILEVGLSPYLVIRDFEFLSLKKGSYACLSVSDTGNGIDANILDQIFEPYFTTKKNGDGSGLGLSILLCIVKGYNGDIDVSSKPGQGSRFRVFLPIESDVSKVSPLKHVYQKINCL